VRFRRGIPDARFSRGACSSPVRQEADVGDKPPKAKQRNKNQKDAAKSQSRNDQAKRQEASASAAGKDNKKR
jgi:hypothetical protein